MSDIQKPILGFAGLSHLGLVSAISLTKKGFQIVAFDTDSKLVSDLNAGKLPVIEANLPEILAANRAAIKFTDNPADLANVGICWVAPDVATSAENESDTSQVQELAELAGENLSKGATLVIHSQVTPGFTRNVMNSAPDGIEVVYQVETLIFGRAVQRVLHPERLIFGKTHEDSILPASVLNYAKSFDCPVLEMPFESAELSKMAINLYLSAQI